MPDTPTSNTPMTVLVTGGSGFIGTALVRRLRDQGHSVRVLTRSVSRTTRRLGPGVVVSDRIADLVRHPIDLVVNLAGAPVVGHPWTQRRRSVLRDSRIALTESLVTALAQAPRAKAPVFVQASAVGYYGQHATRSDEADPPGEDFGGRLCADWEQAADRIRAFGYRLVVLRLGLVLGPDGGILPPLRLSAKFGMAAVLGDGKQPFPWIHRDDVLAAIDFLVRDRRAEGPYNLCAPGVADQRGFTRALARSVSRPAWLRTPAWMLRSGLGDMADMLLHSPPATCRRLREAGYTFVQPALSSALNASSGTL